MITFFSVYAIITHFFLPEFIKLVKARKEITLVNDKELLLIKNNFNQKQLSIKNVLQQNFIKLRVVFAKEFSTFLANPLIHDMSNIDTKLSLVLYYDTLHYDTAIINSIPLKSNF